MPELVYRSDHATVVCIVTNKDKRAAQLTFSADIRDIGTDPGEIDRLARVCRRRKLNAHRTTTEHPSVSGNPTIRIGEEERAVAFRDHPLERLEPGQQAEVRLQIASHSVATQLLAVALQPVKKDDTDVPEYIGIASTNVAFVEPLELEYETWIDASRAAAENPLDNPGAITSQITASFTLKMVGDAKVAIQGISFRHDGLVSLGLAHDRSRL